MSKFNVKYLVVFLLVSIQASGQKFIHLNRPFIDSKHQIFVPLVFQNYSPDTYSFLSDQADSLISFDESSEVTRHFLDFNLGLAHFEIDTSETLILFNNKNEIIGEAQFVHFEHYGDIIESQFYALYSQTKKIFDISNTAYSLYKSDLQYIDKSFKIIDSEAKEFNELNPANDKEFLYSDFSGYKYNESINKMALYSYLTDDNEDYTNYTTVLLEKIGNKDEIILKLTDNYVLHEFYILPIFKNDKPILLFNITVPDSDYIDIMCGYYDTEYKLTGRKVQIE